MTEHTSRSPRHPPALAVTYRHLPVLLPLVLGLLALALTDRALTRQERAAQAAAFSTQATKLQERLRERLHTHDELLRGAAGLHAASRHVSRDEWRAYVAALALDEVGVGIQGLGYSRYLPASEVPAHVQAVRAEGFPDYEVIPPGPRAAYSAIVYLEPFHGRNLRAFGFDMMSEAVRRDAMLRARDSADIAYSGAVRLMQETATDVQAGILAYLPVYQGGLQPRSLAQRRANLVGWVYAPFRLRDLMTAVFQGELKQVRVRVLDQDPGSDPLPGVASGPPRPPTVLFDSQGEGAAWQPDEQAPWAQRPLSLHGRQWLVQYQALPGALALTSTLPHGLALAGVALAAALLCAFTWSLVNTRERARAIAHRLASNVAEGEERFRLLVEGVRDYAILMLDERGTIMSWNAGAARIKGWQAEEAIGRHFSCFYTPQDVEAGVPAQALATALVQGQYREDGWRVRKDGSVFRASVLITAMRDDDGHIKGFAKVTRDVSEHHRQEERLRLAGAVFRSTQEGVAITDVAGKVIAVNPAFERVTEYSEAEVQGQDLRLLASGRHDRDFFQNMWRDLSESGAWQGEIWNRRKGGEVHPAWLAISVVRDERQRVTNYVGVFTDITRIPHAETQMDRLAHHDALTDLPNRLLLQSRLAHTLERAQRGGRTCAVLFLDLDHFKPVNDRHGHQAGDELLKGVAKRLRLHLRENDTVARLGGDEFVIVLEDLASADGAELVARAIIERMQQPFELSGGRAVNIGCSVGIALHPDDGSDGETLLRHADAALYRAKAAGRGAWRFHGVGGG